MPVATQRDPSGRNIQGTEGAAVTVQDYGPGLPPKSLGLPGNPRSGKRSPETERDDPPPGGAGLKSDLFSLGNGVHCFHGSALQSGYMVRRVIGTLTLNPKKAIHWKENEQAGKA